MIRSENDLWKILLPIIDTGIADFSDITVLRGWQPTTQGDGNTPRLLLNRASSRRYGGQGKKVEIRDIDRLVEIESWHKEDTYQAYALVERAPDDFGYTAVDVLERLSAHLQSDSAIDAFKASGVGILRINDIAETPYENDRDEYRISVSLRFTLTYRQEMERDVPVARSIEFEKHRV